MNHLYNIALSLLPRIGPVTSRKLLAHFGSAETFFSQKKSTLTKIPGLGEDRIQNFDLKEILELAEKELKFIEREKIKILYFTDSDYPHRLKECSDAPLLLYQQGDYDLNTSRALSFVGTRTSTIRGREYCQKLIADISKQFPDTTIYSGLAYGIDITSHLAALDNGLKTVAILGHGLQKTYPASHQHYRKRILEQGGAVLTEFSSSHAIAPQNFLQRNRIVAGISEATIIVETGLKGGSIFTARMANSYHRDVLAIPGRPTDKKSQGCNKLIKLNMAALIENIEDLLYVLGWTEETGIPIQKKLPLDLSEEEQAVVQLLSEKNQVHIDTLLAESELEYTRLITIITKLEMSGIITPLPGKSYTLR